MKPWARSYPTNRVKGHLRFSAIAVLAVLTLVGCGLTGIGGSYPEVCSELGYPADRCAAIVRSAQERLPVCTVGVECGRSAVTPKRVISIELTQPSAWTSDRKGGVVVSVLFHLEAGAPDFYPGVSAGQVDFAVDLGGCGLIGEHQPWCR